MNQTVGRVFIAFGILFFVLCFVIYRMASFDVQLGMFWNIMVFGWDCFWFAGTGIYLIVAGIVIQKQPSGQIKRIEWGGYFIIFNLVFFVFTFIFNLLAEPAFQSNGRIFTFCLQSLSRLLKPSFSPDFLVPFASVVIFVVISVLFKRKLVGKE